MKLDQWIAERPDSWGELSQRERNEMMCQAFDREIREEREYEQFQDEMRAKRDFYNAINLANRKSMWGIE